MIGPSNFPETKAKKASCPLKRCRSGLLCLCLWLGSRTVPWLKTWLCPTVSDCKCGQKSMGYWPILYSLGANQTSFSPASRCLIVSTQIWILGIRVLRQWIYESPNENNARHRGQQSSNQNGLNIQIYSVSSAIHQHPSTMSLHIVCFFNPRLSSTFFKGPESKKLISILVTMHIKGAGRFSFQAWTDSILSAWQ